MKGVQCYELFGGIALKNHTFSFFMFDSLFNHFLYLMFDCMCNSKYSVHNNILRKILLHLFYSFLLHISFLFLLYYTVPAGNNLFH